MQTDGAEWHGGASPGVSSTASPADATDTFLFTLDKKTNGGWSSHLALDEEVISNPDPGGAPEIAIQYDAETRRNLLLLTHRFPAPAAILRRVREDRPLWGLGGRFRVEIFVPQEAGAYASVQMVAYHRSWGWFATEPARSLKPGMLSRVFWDLDDASDEWRSMGDAVAWNDSIRRNLTFVGLRFFAPAQTEAPLRIADMAIEGMRASAPELRAVDVQAPRAPVRRGQCFEVTFDLTRGYDNPFDPDQVAVDVDFFTYPASAAAASAAAAADASASPAILTTVTLPAFYFQDYTRRRLEDGTEACDPRGQACWKARFTPRESGPHGFRIRIRDGQDARYESEPRAFTVVDAPFHGFVKIDPKDPRYLSFDGDHSIFYPIGMVIRSAWDSRCGYHYEFEPPQGLETYAYDEYFPRMREAGMNFARVWMAAWWLALEWSRGYRQDFEGLGRYSQFNAWRMDHIIRLGEKYGVYFDITLNNHGQFAVRSELDREWTDNPLYIANNGFLRSSPPMWTDAVSRSYAAKRLRYIVARWGYSPAIAWFLVCNEVNLVYAYNSNNIRSWHEFVTTTVKSLDPYQHLCSSHWCYGTFDPNVGGQPWLEVKQSNGYSHDMIASSNYLWKQLSAYKQPAYINEYGMGWDSPEYMKYNLHAGLWASSVTPFCGPALHWYFLYIHHANQYDQFRALAAFHRDEDYRGLNLQPSSGVWVENTDRKLEAVAQQSDERAYIWIYDKTLYRQNPHSSSRAKQFSETPFSVEGLKAGKYRVEFWDTWQAGELYSERREIAHAGGKLALKTPPFSRDIACKVIRTGE
ncbi:MAG: hypothetical protein NTX50_08610 [Candidatus Sumerlaeota bacterium]|nr:hypothetical protein [Candidatus Sumerlaeota bacterium]